MAVGLETRLVTTARPAPFRNTRPGARAPARACHANSAGSRDKTCARRTRRELAKTWLTFPRRSPSCVLGEASYLNGMDG